MDDVAAARRRAMKLMAERMRTEEGQALFKERGYSGGPIVVAADEEPIGDVMKRVVKHHPPVVIAVAFGAECEQIGFMEMGPAAPESVQAEDVFKASATIGMLYQASKVSSRLTFALDAWNARQVGNLSEPGGELVSH